MAGIFNFFGGTTHGAKQQSLSGPNDSAVKLTKPIIFGNVGTAPGKNVLLTPVKPKGLSMRSKSELNVVQPNGNGAKSPRKKSPIKALTKGYFDSTECPSKPLSPRMKEKCSKMEAMKLKQLKAASSRTFDDLSDEKKQTEETVFKKPLTPPMRSKKLQQYPMPEKLSYYYNEKKYLDCNIDPLDQEFIKFVRITNDPIKPYEDEGFESDPELISDIDMPIPDVTDDVGDILVEAPTMELPVLSDDDDDIFLD